MITAVAVFAVSAVFGLYLAVRHFTQKPLGMTPALAHGAFGAAGLVLLILACLKGGGFVGFPAIALGIFVVAALGGFVLFSMHLRGKRLFTPLVLIHAVAAVAAFALLLVAALKGA